MSDTETFLRASRGKPCPTCGRDKYCVTIDGRLQLCTKVQEGSVRASRDGSGWIHVLRDERGCPRQRIEPRRKVLPPNLRGAIDRAQRLTTDDDLRTHANALGLPTGGQPALRRLGAHLPRYDADELLRLSPRDAKDAGLLRAQVARLDREAADWLAFPMWARGCLIGARLRHKSGHKMALRGGREGLFVPSNILPEGDLLCVVEGATDCAALHSVGIEAIGRPNCTGAVDETVRLMLEKKPRSVGVLADRDAPGIKGAAVLARQLSAVVADVRIALPPEDCKDARQWITQGARARDILAAIEGGRRV